MTQNQKFLILIKIKKKGKAFCNPFVLQKMTLPKLLGQMIMATWCVDNFFTFSNIHGIA